MKAETVKILAVDDQSEGLQVLEEVLHGAGHELIKANSGQEALRQLLDNDFALILLDVQMPELDGYETARLIRSRDRSRATPIIFLAASYPDQELPFRGYDAGAVDFIFKPIDVEILRAKVNVFVEMARAAEEVKHLNSLLTAQTRELLAANRELEAFAFTASHDLKAPLRAIESFSGILLEECGAELSSTRREYLEKICAASNRMSELIDDLLQLARIARLPLCPEALEIDAVAKQIFEELRSKSPGREAELVTPNPLPARGDPKLLRIALENLLGNSWKYTRRQARSLIEIGMGRGTDGKITYFVRDNGVGFDMRRADKLFTPFHRE